MADALLDPSTDVTPRHVLVPVDGSPASLGAVVYAAAIARQTGARLDLLAVVDVASTSYYAGMVQPLELVERGFATEVRRAAELVPPDVPVTTFVDRGKPAERIAHHAEAFGCDLIVMGSRGRGRATAALFGSTSLAVLHATRVPVLVTRAQAELPVAVAV
jgi:nucleotide-binding universal stress UspA family protein